MITKTLLLVHLFFAADLQDISNRLADNSYKIRKAAIKEAKELSNDDKRALIKILKESKDPEKTESAKILLAMLPESNNFDEILDFIKSGKNEEFKKAVQYNPPY